MEMEVVVAIPPPPPPPLVAAPVTDFNFDSTCSSPYMTAPSSPQRFGNFFLSAPASPTRFSSSSNLFLDQFNSSSSVPFDWEEKPGTPKSRNGSKNKNKNQGFDFLDDDGGDFEFDFSGQLDRSSLSAEELFDGGKIRPLRLPPGFDSAVSSPKSSPSPSSRNAKKKKDSVDPFQAAINETTRNRGRENKSSSKNYARKVSRSLSPLRVSDIILDDQENNNSNNIITPTTTENISKSLSSIFSAISFSSKGNKKWKLKDLLLFRSASEGRPIAKYGVLSKKEVSDASFRSTDSSVGGSSRRRGPVSAHEMHYTENRAVSEEMRRKTFLPYKRGLLGCLGFNPGVHEISRGIGSLARG
ncbi:uncharacterized protein LOC126679994 [Mercurialis annua]|uniref:uncharacterized protein LOC126679994 n=1 Tax=Mercurialis annua TaxID=3986 RepID=UPI00215E59E2|nr:uncharacterized protein LOC126679994 [Mercurialis annua]